mgnify:FL=1
MSADRLVPLPFNPVPTHAQLRDRLSLAIANLSKAGARWESLDDNERVRIADVLNRYASPLVVHLDHLHDHPRTVA